jgi:hypothetical protein
MNVIATQCRRIDSIIRKMLSITRYRTREYLPGTNIVDLDAATADDPPSRKEG